MNEHNGTQRGVKGLIANALNRPLLGVLVALAVIVGVWIGLQLVLPALT
ncbi:hypothetical protein [Streptomyces sp. CC77]|nr:hypothetical protein [Streptomyces sp. CC77]